VYSERPDDWEENLKRLSRKHETARTMVPEPLLDERDGAEIGIIAYGSTCDAINEARDQLRGQGVETSFIRLRALPFESTLTDFVNKYKRLYVVELTEDAQLRSLIQLHVPTRAAELRSLAHLDGLPLTASYVRKGILAGEGSR
jgi:2-oxoglutarate ferredoxin oxidoreductase subunit alpha